MKTSVVIALAVSISIFPMYTNALAQFGPDQPEVLTRGAVHEAFAEPVNFQVEAGLIVQSQPPEFIQEVPPIQRPVGGNYVWIPGYWAWEPDRNNYIWTSACWRIAPPNCSWVPGYWIQVSGGWQWVAGFWTAGDIRDIQYLPPPPSYIYQGPPGPPPSPDNIWVPPVPYWQTDHYTVRPGYWLPANPDWIWIPSSYIWTPRGYVFIEGRWDYPLEHRGVLFAPVYFPPSIYGRRGYSYTPSIVVDIGLLRVNLFTYPRYCHYYFGDYYDASYISIGIFPRYEFEHRHSWYDPIYTHERWRHRDDRRWEENYRRDYERRRSDRDLRPPRTYREIESRRADTRLPQEQRRNFQIAQPLTAVASSREAPVRFQQIDNTEQQNIAKRSGSVQSFTQDRSKYESSKDRQAAPPSLPSELKTPAQQPSEQTAQRRPPTPPQQERTGRERAGQREEQTRPGERQQPGAQPQPRPGEREPQTTQPSQRMTGEPNTRGTQTGQQTAPEQRQPPATRPQQQRPGEHQQPQTQPQEKPSERMTPGEPNTRGTQTGQQTAPEQRQPPATRPQERTGERRSPETQPQERTTREPNASSTQSPQQQRPGQRPSGQQTERPPERITPGVRQPPATQPQERTSPSDHNQPQAQPREQAPGQGQQPQEQRHGQRARRETPPGQIKDANQNQGQSGTERQGQDAERRNPSADERAQGQGGEERAEQAEPNK